MSFKKIKAFLQLCRPVNVIITSGSIPVAYWIAGGTFRVWLPLLIAVVTGALVTSGANAINDLFDIEIDRINRPDRPLPSGLLTKKDAWSVWFSTSLLVLSANIFISINAFLIVFISVVILFMYSARLKRTVFTGNFAVAMMTGTAFIYGGAVAGHADRAFLPALFAFLANLARELIKDAEDIEGDREKEALTLAVRYGIRPALIISTLILSVLVGSTFVAVYYGIYNQLFLYFVLAADLLIVVSVYLMWKDNSPANMGRVSLMLKFCMILGIVSIIAGSI